ncbi:hypothetical protein AI2772V1_4647 (plasmid) [Enterobacter cloacae]|nr:hypothetical protein AI2772V1_4647 [Enterobacter cloacae]CAH3921327.1 hypothetical protein AI2772V1_4647 [Enterobacter cloacae]
MGRSVGFKIVIAMMAFAANSVLCRIALKGVVSENGIYGHSRFCNTDFDDKLACLNLSGV